MKLKQMTSEENNRGNICRNNVNTSKQMTQTSGDIYYNTVI